MTCRECAICRGTCHKIRVFIDVQGEHLSLHQHTAGTFFSRIKIGFCVFVIRHLPTLKFLFERKW